MCDRRDDVDARKPLLPLPASARSSCDDGHPRHRFGWPDASARPHKHAPRRGCALLTALSAGSALIVLAIGLVLLTVAHFKGIDALKLQSLLTVDVAAGYDGPSTVRCPAGDVPHEAQLDAALLELEGRWRAIAPLNETLGWGRTIWTSAKRVEDVPARVRDSWESLNEAYTYTVLDDDAARRVIIDTFATSSLGARVVGVYDGFDRVVLKTDFLRYVLLWRFGGVWSDADTICMQPVDRWIPQAWREDPTVHAILASELDKPFRLDPDWLRLGWTAVDRGYQLVQWCVTVIKRS